MARFVATVLAIALLISVAMTVLGILVVAAAACGLSYLGWWLWREHRSRGADREHRQAELVARAELQHRWYMAGDPRGTYGRYPPAVEMTR
jgi:threonine/homoserine/homoserine lactone efflux protein